MSLNLTHAELEALTTGLHYLRMAELKNIAERLALPTTNAKKNDLIKQICTFTRGETVNTRPRIPEVSRARKGHIYPLTPLTLMLSGAYKNDLPTRMFFKQLIGPHFHFTAFGIDWLNERWYAGNPPTYQEFADFWIAETERRRLTPAAPKPEWAYITFVQKLLKIHPDRSGREIKQAWFAEHDRQQAIVENILKKLER